MRPLHPAYCSRSGVQVAGCCDWAVVEKWQRGDTELYDRIKPALRSEFDIFRTGATYYD